MPTGGGGGAVVVAGAATGAAATAGAVATVGGATGATWSSDRAARAAGRAVQVAAADGDENREADHECLRVHRRDHYHECERAPLGVDPSRETRDGPHR